MHFDKLVDTIFCLHTAVILPTQLNCANTVSLALTVCAKRLLQDENFSSSARSDVLDGLTLLANDEAYVAVSHFDSFIGRAKRTCLSNVDCHL